MASKYIDNLPKDTFIYIDEKINNYKGDMINLAVGNPDSEPNEFLIERLSEYVKDKNLHGYGDFTPHIGSELKKSISNYYQYRFGANTCPKTEISELAGTKEGIYYTLSSILNEGDKVLIPSPSYSVYTSCLHLLGGEAIYFKCEEESFIPYLETINEEDLITAKAMILCSPGNPTTTILPKEFLCEAIDLARKYNIVIIHDLAYSELVYNNWEINSILSLPGGKEVSVELYSLSKSCNLAGWRIGFALGNSDIIRRIKILRFNISFGLFLPLQKAAIDAINNMESFASIQRDKYKKRLELFVTELNNIGWKTNMPQGTFFIWTRIPKPYEHLSDIEFTSYLLEKTGILVAPGSGFGEGGRDYIRIALVQNEEILQKALNNIKKMFTFDFNLKVKSIEAT